MTDYTANECMIAWNPDEEIEVGPWPDETGWSRRFRYTAGACFSEREDYGLVMMALAVMTNFNTITVRDRIDPQTAHREFLKIREYRLHISPDIAGAEDFDQAYAVAFGREMVLTRDCHHGL